MVDAGVQDEFDGVPFLAPALEALPAIFSMSLRITARRELSTRPGALWVGARVVRRVLWNW